MTLNSLPPEIALQIFSFLPVSSLANLHSVSRAWNSFLLHNETTVYRKAAFLHGIIDDDAASLDSAVLSQKYSQRILRNVDSWKALCKTRIRIRNAWNGVGPSHTQPKIITRFRQSVHRIKVDEQRKLIITTSAMDFPRVEVQDMETGRELWFLEPSMGRMYAHLEYSNGFLIFDRSSGDREVWRLSSSELTHPVPFSERPLDFDLKALPDALMLGDSQKALQNVLRHYPGPVGSDFRPRGCFEPYAVLCAPEPTSAYRFVYPTLMTAAHERVYMWDVPSARIVELVSGIQKARLPIPMDRGSHENMSGLFQVGDESDSGDMAGESVGNEVEDDESDSEDDDGDVGWLDEVDEEEGPVDVYLLRSINYVDHSPTHILLAGHHILKVFTRAYITEDTTQSSRLAFVIPSTRLRYGRWKYTIKLGTRRQPESALVPYKFDVSTMDLPQAGRLFDEFTAAHVSPCGSHLVALLNGVRLLIIPHFKKLVGQPEEVVYNHVLDVQLGSPAVSKSIYLAYEEGDGAEGRVGVVTSTAVLVITLPYFSLDYSKKTPPVLRISRVKELMDPEKLGAVSCLMMSDTRLFLNFDPSTIVRGRQLQDWEQNFEEALRYFQENELECYGRKKDRFFIKDLPETVSRPYSTVYEVDMLPLLL